MNLSVGVGVNFLERLTFVGDYNARARLLPDGRKIFVRRNGVFHIAWQDLLEDRLLVLTESSLDESLPLLQTERCIYATQIKTKAFTVVSVMGGSNIAPSSAGDVREPAWSPFLPTW